MPGTLGGKTESDGGSKSHLKRRKGKQRGTSIMLQKRIRFEFTREMEEAEKCLFLRAWLLLASTRGPPMMSNGKNKKMGLCGCFHFN